MTVRYFSYRGECLEEKVEAEREVRLGLPAEATQVADIGSSGGQTSLPPP